MAGFKDVPRSMLTDATTTGAVEPAAAAWGERELSTLRIIITAMRPRSAATAKVARVRIDMKSGPHRNSLVSSN
jgi:hypothetical protein